MYFNTLFFFF